MNRELRMNPWLNIWIRPRKTIRAIIDYQETYRFFVLCFLNGLMGVFFLAQALDLGAIYSPLLIVGASLLLAIPYGYLNFTITTFFIFIVGKLIKGKGSFKQVRAAISWASIPSLVGVLMWWLLIVGLKKKSFFSASGCDAYLFTWLLCVRLFKYLGYGDLVAYGRRSAKLFCMDGLTQSFSSYFDRCHCHCCFR